MIIKFTEAYVNVVSSFEGVLAKLIKAVLKKILTVSKLIKYENNTSSDFYHIRFCLSNIESGYPNFNFILAKGK